MKKFLCIIALALTACAAKVEVAPQVKLPPKVVLSTNCDGNSACEDDLYYKLPKSKFEMSAFDNDGNPIIFSVKH